jgi:hypothetical protein
VIVIDALDKCGGLDGSRSKDQIILLQGMKAWRCLASWYKLVITIRPEDDTSQVLLEVSYHIELGFRGNVCI